jgi:hypothetical protein
MNDSVRLALRRILDDYGTPVCSDHRRFENLMRDLCSHDRREVSILSRALAERVAADMLAQHDSVPRAVMLARLAKRLEDNLALTPAAARWAVECWAAALLDGAGERPRSRWYQFSGEGRSAATAPFALDAGLAIFETAHGGPDNLLIELLDGAGRHRELVANVIGRGSVRALGEWSVEVRQPSSPAAQEKPVTFEGVGQQVSPFVRLEGGANRFNTTHKGGSNFIVRLLSADGGFVELLANQIGHCRTSREVWVERPGTYLLDVSTDGEWAVEVR